MNNGKFQRFTTLPVLACAMLLLTVGFFCGCADRVIVSEVLQQDETQEIRTAYNLFYTDPAGISCLNYMEGNFLPAGSVVTPVEALRGSYNFMGHFGFSDGKITFADENNQQYTIYYDERLTMIPMEDFIQQFFTLKSRDAIYENVPEADLPLVEKGELKVGMSSNAVLVLLGPPARTRTTSITNQSWLYWKNRDQVFRVIFKGDKIRYIGTLED